MVIAYTNLTYTHKLGDSTLKDAERPVFTLKRLNLLEHAQALDLAGTPGQQLAFLLESGLKGWDNLKDTDGAIVPWPGSPLKAADMLPALVRQSLALRIFLGPAPQESPEEENPSGAIEADSNLPPAEDEITPILERIPS